MTYSNIRITIGAQLLYHKYTLSLMTLAQDIFCLDITLFPLLFHVYKKEVTKEVRGGEVDLFIFVPEFINKTNATFEFFVLKLLELIQFIITSRKLSEFEMRY